LDSISKYQNKRIKTVGSDQRKKLFKKLRTAFVKELYKKSEETTGRVRPDGSVGVPTYSVKNDDGILYIQHLEG
jgi:hypothetical protein